MGLKTSFLDQVLLPFGVRLREPVGPEQFDEPVGRRTHRGSRTETQTAAEVEGVVPAPEGSRGCRRTQGGLQGKPNKETYHASLVVLRSATMFFSGKHWLR